VVAKALHQEYDAVENIVFVTHPEPVHLETPADIDAYFDAVIAFWRDECKRRRAYYLVDWKGFSLNMRETTFYSRHIKKVSSECAITIVRYGTDPLRRAATRLMALKLHLPSNIYDTREEAMMVIRGLKDGSIHVAGVA
jgi:hypothetical protein